MKSATFWIGLVAGLVLSALIAGILPFVGVFDMTATGSPHILDWWGETNLDSTVSKRAPDAALPSTASADSGLNHYASTCLLCHGAPEAKRQEWAETMLPQPPQLWQGEAGEMQDGELFYIVSNGVRMSGMPAFGPRHAKEDIWNLVAVIRNLDSLEPHQLEKLKKASMTGGHHGEEGDEDHSHQ